jgi:hypothetical protein
MALRKRKNASSARDAKAIQALKDSVVQVESSVKKLDLQIRKVRRAIEHLPPWHFKPGEFPWSFNAGRTVKTRKRK